MDTIPIRLIFLLLQKLIIEKVSDVSPLYEIKITISFFSIAPREPWPASLASIKKLEIPTEEKVLLKIAPTAPDFPVPENITLPPFLFNILLTALSKDLLIVFFNFFIALVSSSITFFAICFKSIFFIQFFNVQMLII